MSELTGKLGELRFCKPHGESAKKGKKERERERRKKSTGAKVLTYLYHLLLVHF